MGRGVGQPHAIWDERREHLILHQKMLQGIKVQLLAVIARRKQSIRPSQWGPFISSCLLAVPHFCSTVDIQR